MVRGISDRTPPIHRESLVAQVFASLAERAWAHAGQHAVGAIEEVGHAGAAGIAQAAVRVNVRQADDFVANHGKRWIVVEIENRLEQAVGSAGCRRNETREKILILTIGAPQSG